MLGLSLDPKEDAPREYAKKNDLNWTQGFLGDWSKTQIPGRVRRRGNSSDLSYRARWKSRFFELARCWHQERGGHNTRKEVTPDGI